MVSPSSQPTKTALVRKNSSRPKRQGAEVLHAPVFADLPWLIHGFSTRTGGVSTCYGGKTLNLGMAPDDTPRNVQQNRKLFLQALGAHGEEVRSWPLLQVKQVHSAIVHAVTARSQNAVAGDGLVTNDPNLLLGIKTADCVPVLLADAKGGAIGAFHAGWRGTVARIVEKGVGQMRRHFGSEPGDLRAAIGPCIRRCCYQVGPEVRAEFESQFSYAESLFEEVFDYNSLHVRYPMLFLNKRAPGHGDPASELHLDLVEAIKHQLQDAGLANENVTVMEGCTACDTTRFFSHRAEFGKTGRMMAVIGILADKK